MKSRSSLLRAILDAITVADAPLDGCKIALAQSNPALNVTRNTPLADFTILAGDLAPKTVVWEDAFSLDNGNGRVTGEVATWTLADVEDAATIGFVLLLNEGATDWLACEKLTTPRTLDEVGEGYQFTPHYDLEVGNV